jgi:hypothetical protein
MQVRRFRPLTVSVTVLWLATVLVTTYESPDHKPVPPLGAALLIACPLYIVGIGVWRTIGHGALEAAAAETHLASA